MAKIENLYRDVIKNQTTWNYYISSMDCNDSNNILYIKAFKDLYVENSEASYNFIHSMLFHSGKDAAKELFSCFEAISKNDKERLRHIVSLFFLGHIFYSKIPIIREKINCQLPHIIDSNQNPQKLFAFIWFVLCVFHDFGYAYEKGVISVSGFSEKLAKPKDFIPTIYSEDNIRKYELYRKCKFNVNDHGIYGGQAFYNDMLTIGKEYYKELKNKDFRTENVEHIYKYAAWIISCHNIFYNNGNDKYTDCYKCCGLDDFIKPKARCITLKNNPLLFLFCLADTLEPTKKLKSKMKSKTNNPQRDLEICKLLKMNFGKDTITFDLSALSDYVAGDEYAKNIKGIDGWLADVSDKLTITLK